MEQVPTSMGRQVRSEKADRPTRVYLARHGRTPLNSAGVLRGHLDPPLDDVGRHEAARLAAALAGRRPEIIVTSPLQRAVETANAVAALVGKVVHTEPRLVDRNYGHWAGLPREAVEADWGSLDNAPGVEPREEVEARAREALNDLVAKTTTSVAVAVTHDAVIRILLVSFAPQLGDPDTVPQETGSFNTLEHVGGHWTVLDVNEIPATPA